jgi:hypothetical protein
MVNIALNAEGQIPKSFLTFLSLVRWPSRSWLYTDLRSRMGSRPRYQLVRKQQVPASQRTTGTS